MHYIDREGVRLAYFDVGGAERPPMLLVHGWCSNAAALEPLAAAFRGDYRVVSIDLRGNGASDAPEGAEHYAVTTSAGDLGALCDHLGLRGAVVVAHSLGGAAAVKLAGGRPDLVAAVVALDGAVLYPDEERPQAAELVAALRSPAWLQVMNGLVEATHLTTDDPEVLRHEKELVAATPQHVVADAAEQMLVWDAETAAKALGGAGLPVLFIQSTGGPGLADLERFATFCPQLVTGRVIGLGHNQMVATPAQAVAMIEGFLRGALGRRPADNVTPVRELFTAITTGDLDAIDRLVSPDFVDHGAPPGTPPGPAAGAAEEGLDAVDASGLEGYKGVFRLLRGALQMRWELLDQVAAGDRVALRVRTTGCHVGEFLGIPPTGRAFSTEAMHVYRVEDGVLREHWAVRDDLGLFRQLGVTPPS